ncbi:unnamed protein product [Effrenium voratum]|nr:unnamed protein product [Effrenium voratum]
MFASLFRSRPPKSAPGRSEGGRGASPSNGKAKRAVEPGQGSSKKARRRQRQREEEETQQKQLQKQQRRQQQQKQHNPQPKDEIKQEDPGEPSQKKDKKMKKKKQANQQAQSMPAADPKPEASKSLKRRQPEHQKQTQKQGALNKAAARLKGSRFRWLNETLYTRTGKEALELFSSDPSLAEAYHEGFRAQAAKWPRNPLDDVIRWIKKKVRTDAVIGDFGCGDARLALELPGRKVHSFDLVQINERVTACNLASVPLPGKSLDVAIFCLALMGTDWVDFVTEAWRCLKPGGLCHIVEVESRFADLQAVVRTIESVGFKQVLVNPGSFFVEMRFRRGDKEARPKPLGEGSLLSACTYRKR